VRRRLASAPHTTRFAAAVVWFVAPLALLCVVGWHDGMVRSYWQQQYRKGELFIGQSRFRPPRAPSDNPGRPYAVWLWVMRYEADFSVGLVPASAGVVLVTAARRRMRRRRWSGPGAVTCLTAIAAMGLCVLEPVIDFS
jgi:hypothetical protein